jgi:hypothetical protein
MKKLLTLTIVLLVLALSAPSYGYVLVYKVTGKMKAVEWNASTLGNVPVKGYLAVNINDSDDANYAQLILYGKDTSDNLVFFLDTLSSGENINWDVTEEVIGVDVWDYDDPFEYEFMMTGKVKLVDVGFGTSNKKTAASSLKGSLVSWWGQLLDDSQELFGSGTATMTLDTKQTKDANIGLSSVDDVITALINGLEDKGYSAIIL